jgi:hypothetical protein
VAPQHRHPERRQSGRPGIETFPKLPLPYNGPDTHIREEKKAHLMRDTNRQGTVGRRRRLRTGLIVSALLGIVLVATACAGGSNGPGVAGQGSSTTPSASPSVDRMDAALAYAKCMREHGISDFPDPQPGGGIAIQAGPGSDLDPDNPQFKAADEACRSLLPTPSEEDQQRDFADMLRYAQCMREHGIPDFPDPKPGEGISISADQGSDLDPNNPQFQAANKACGGPGKPDTSEQTNGGTP